jgi:hypothetical protein
VRKDRLINSDNKTACHEYLVFDEIDEVQFDCCLIHKMLSCILRKEQEHEVLP